MISHGVPGQVVLVAHRGVIVHRKVAGEAVRYSDATGTVLPPAERVPMRFDTIFDLASISKLLTAVVALRCAELGQVDLDEPVAAYAAELANGELPDITMRHLLTHISGLPPVRELWTVQGGRAERAAAVLRTVPSARPGLRHVYSCVGYLVTGLLLERVTGDSMADLVARHITEPLGMIDTCLLPPRSVYRRIAATEDQSAIGRGMVRGEVHDESSWSLDGIGGNAGVFGTAADLLRFAEALRCGGIDPASGSRILATESVAAMTTDQVDGLADYGQGVGPRIADRSFMGDRVSARSFGHTGFTGTSLVVDPARELVVIVLANAVHPVRGRIEMGPLRRAEADAAVATVAAAA